MQALYPYFQIIHLCCAIIFVGYLFFDVVIFRLLRKPLGDREFEKIQDLIASKITRFMPFVVLLLFLSGGAMASAYLRDGFLDSAFGKVFMAKILLASCIFLLVIFSLSMAFIFKKPNPLGKYIHLIVFSIGAGVVLLAKIMFIVG